MNLNINNKKVIEVVSQIMYKKYVESLKDVKVQKITLHRHFASSGSVNRQDEFNFVLLEDPSKWSYLKLVSCSN